MARLDGRVAIVTGAGRGIGRSVALLLASEGASVVVNDLGGAVDGSGADTGPAGEVVAEIAEAGGKAIANGADVSDHAAAENLVASAIEQFGRLDVLVNVAGILRDRMIFNMTEQEWDDVIRVHLKGTFNTTKFASSHWRSLRDETAQNRIINFTSVSGLHGAPGQPNYAAAKMGIVGLSRIIAMEGAQKNVRSNVIAPFAWTRMIATIPIKDEASAKRVDRMKNMMRADQVAQLAVALASPATKDVSGQIFVARGNEIFLMSQPRPIRGIGKVEGWTPETIANHAMAALKPSFVELGATTSVFGWDPV
jgi:NAD(P)-dependent dehydrogenase (short-subunit alcohol dehydrogenase family)